MSIMVELEELKEQLLNVFKGQIDSGSDITQMELEKAIEVHQDCGFVTAKYLIRLLSDHYAWDLNPIYRKIDPNTASIEIKDIFIQAQQH